MSRRIRQSGVYTLQATETYDANNPADSPVSWGSAADVEAMNQEMTATTNGVTHLGALITFTPLLPDVYNGVYVKVRPTYNSPEAPAIEMWTHNSVSGVWTKKRRVSISNLLVGVRSTEFKIFTLFQSSGDDNIDQVWITMAPSNPQGTQALEFFAIWPYGTCTENLTTPNPTDGDLPPIPDVPGAPSCFELMRTLGLDPHLCNGPTGPLTCEEMANLLGIDPQEVCHGDPTCEAIAHFFGLDPNEFCKDLTCTELATILGLNPNDVCVNNTLDCTQTAVLLGYDPAEFCQVDPPFPNDPPDDETPYMDPETLEFAPDPNADNPDGDACADWTIRYQEAFVIVGTEDLVLSLPTNRSFRAEHYLQDDFNPLGWSTPQSQGFKFTFSDLAVDLRIAVRVRVALNALNQGTDVVLTFLDLVGTDRKTIWSDVVFGTLNGQSVMGEFTNFPDNTPSISVPWQGAYNHKKTAGADEIEFNFNLGNTQLAHTLAGSPNPTDGYMRPGFTYFVDLVVLQASANCPDLVPTPRVTFSRVTV